MSAPSLPLPPEPEFSRAIDVRKIDGKEQKLTASPQECAALAERFSLVSIARLMARVRLAREGGIVLATGRLCADIVQSCAISGEDLPVSIDEPLELRFISETASAALDEELELSADACDEIPFAGDHFDLGEAVAQSLALAIDPFATGPEAEKTRKKAGLLDEGASGPFAALAALKAQEAKNEPET